MFLKHSHTDAQILQSSGRVPAIRIMLLISTVMFQFSQSSQQMKSRLPFFVYFLGMFPLGYWQDSVRALLGNWLAFIAVIGYLLTLRLIGWEVVQLVDFRHKKSIIEYNCLVEELKKK